MVLINLSLVTFFFNLIHILYCERRIQGGDNVNKDKIYSVYFLKASVSPMRYIGWLCGGAIVTEWYIVTSAACVQDVKHIYAIAGYREYVNAKDIDNNECTKNTKKKIIFSCVPRSYNFEYLKIEKWAHIDIAVVKVETQYDFTDKSYLKYCSYIPGPIRMNFDGKYQEPGTDTIVLGWGHNKKFRKEQDLTIYNEKIIKYAPLLIVPKSVCKDAYKTNDIFLKTIDKYMICAHGAGNLDDTGDLLNTSIARVDGCVTEEQKKKGLRGVSCEVISNYNGNPYDEVYESDDDEINDTRRDIFTLKSRRDNKDENDNKPNDKDKDEAKDKNDKDKSFDSTVVGICQNDHGGPLVTWVGSREILIGVATAFIVSDSFECKGPYLFTSTQCNSAFLDCIINNSTHTSAKRRMCENPPEIGFKMIRRYISWSDHPSGAAKNESLETRQQISIQRYHYGNP